MRMEDTACAAHLVRKVCLHTLLYHIHRKYFVALMHESI